MRTSKARICWDAGLVVRRFLYTNVIENTEWGLMPRRSILSAAERAEIYARGCPIVC